MDSDRFDEITRSLSASTARRGVVTGLAGGLLALRPPALDPVEIAAKKRRKRKRKKQKNACTPNCDRKICGDDGCGGACGDCGACADCQDGVCKLKPDNTACNGTGKCLDGTCNPFPTCKPAGSFCGFSSECCSADCIGAISCADLLQGEPCTVSGDCDFGPCVGYRCQA